jgi:hypothetical protein
MIEASCHCGAIRLKVASPPDRVTDCNCSLCRRLGTLWAYYPPGEVEIIEAPGASFGYVQGDRSLATHSCGTCGCTAYWLPLEGKDENRMGINARLFGPEILAGARVLRFDGAETWTLLSD